MDSKECEFEGKIYSQGAEFRTRVRCFKCSNGTWEKNLDPGRERDFVDWL